METNLSQDQAKRAAGIRAITTYLRNGMKIGLGSGTTSRWFLQTLGDRVKEGLEVPGGADIEFDARSGDTGWCAGGRFKRSRGP